MLKLSLGVPNVSEPFDPTSAVVYVLPYRLIGNGSVIAVPQSSPWFTLAVTPGTIGPCCGRNTVGQLWLPGGTNSKAAARILPDSRVVRLHRAIGPTPLAACAKGHVGLDLNPVSARAKNRSLREVNCKRGADYHDWLVQKRIIRSSGKAPVVKVNVDIPRVSRSGAVEVRTVGINGRNIPDLTWWHDKVVGQIGTKCGKVSECGGQRRAGRSVIVLIVED